MLSNLEDVKGKMRSDDRILVLKPIEGKATTATTGAVDKRLFTGGNSVHVVMDTQTCLWSVKYTQGVVPGAFRQKFTTFGQALAFAKEYFGRRNIEVVEVLD